MLPGSQRSAAGHPAEFFCLEPACLSLGDTPSPPTCVRVQRTGWLTLHGLGRKAGPSKKEGPAKNCLLNPRSMPKKTRRGRPLLPRKGCSDSSLDDDLTFWQKVSTARIIYRPLQANAMRLAKAKC